MQPADRLQSEIARYLIGPKLKALRLRCQMGLLQVAQRSGLSAALLSRVENGKHLPTVPTLLRISRVFNVTLDHFFRDERPRRVVSLTREKERQGAFAGDPAGNDGCFLSQLDLGSGERKFHPYLAEFFPGKKARPHAHEGVEFIYVVLGRLGLLIGNEENVLGPGDSIYFDSSLRHAYRGLSKGRCTAVMICAAAGRNPAERRMDRLEVHVVGRRSQADRTISLPPTAAVSNHMQPSVGRDTAPAELEENNKRRQARSKTASLELPGPLKI